MNKIQFAIAQALKDKKSLGVFIISASFLFIMLIAIPIFTIPGNTLQFQLEIFRVRDYFLMLFLSVLAGLNFALYWFASKQRKNRDITESVAGGAASSIAGIFGAIVGTASCASCLAAIFALIGLGTGSVFFVLNNQSYFLLGSIALMFISLYFAARKVNRICNSC